MVVFIMLYYYWYYHHKSGPPAKRRESDGVAATCSPSHRYFSPGFHEGHRELRARQGQDSHSKILRRNVLRSPSRGSQDRVSALPQLLHVPPMSRVSLLLFLSVPHQLTPWRPPSQCPDHSYKVPDTRPSAGASKSPTRAISRQLTSEGLVSRLAVR